MVFNLQRLRYERLSRKVTEQKMAETLNINRSSYHKKENGNIKISVEEFGKILEVLGIPQTEAGIFFTLSFPEREQTTA
ncbi:helix-turn-helix domain-containing protein [Cohnella sp. AR92]|uniref:helix-turn-helix domain-containing protein n=1 Tax=Cohnella sp. AR92 TaxID=648716 RepID=UPI0013152C37|nr:helix-turn-helix transcriptional regulator [Cohnella sp. AR92]